MIDLGMIDATWLDKFPEPLRLRIKLLMDNPNS